MILGVFAMYISSNDDQLTIEDFFMPFGGKMLKTHERLAHADDPVRQTMDVVIVHGLLPHINGADRIQALQLTGG